ncbi:hypothetical protein ACHAWC_003140 [Mediolabrus comicus]
MAAVSGPPNRRRSTGRTASMSRLRLLILMITSFLFGLAVCSTFLLWKVHNNDPVLSTSHLPHYHNVASANKAVFNTKSQTDSSLIDSSSTSTSILEGLRILVTIASFDFMQLPHLEEVLDGFRDLCYAGSKVDIVIYTTVVYPVAFIDMFNDRMRCNNPSPNAGLTTTMILKPNHVRLHLVDFHRELFYDRIDQYDVFIYTEDDIRVSPTTVASYLHETERVERIVGSTHATDYNVGIVRYEYDFPENVIITDKTRHATENVTRVYWEHLGKPVMEKAVKKVDDEALSPYYISMTLHHQGMYLATPRLLKAWTTRKNCHFDQIRDRPARKDKPGQPTEGTQRVWMSSQMLYGGKHCAVTQLLPVDNFGQLTVLHLPNKNYRRVGKQGRIGGNDKAPKNEFSDGTEVFERSHPLLLKALELHIEMKKEFPNLKTLNVGKHGEYTGVRVVDTDVKKNHFHKDHKAAFEERLNAYREYVSRGGYLTKADMDLDVEGWTMQA